MATEIKVPELGESVVDATLVRWLKQEGDRVNVGEAVAELETDKVDVEVTATQSGVLARIERQAGDDVKLGEVIGIIEAEAQVKSEETAEAKAKPEAEQEAEEEGAGTRGPVEAAMPGRATPVAQRLAEEQEIDLAQVVGSGPGGRVTQRDIKAFLEQRGRSEEQGQAKAEAEAPEAQAEMEPVAKQAPYGGGQAREAEAPQAEHRAQTKPASPPAIAPSQDGLRGEERVRMSRRRQTIARRLVEAQQTAAMLTTFNEVDMGAVMALRSRHKAAFQERYGTGLGILSFFVRASIGALKAFPRLNAEIQGDEIVLKHYYDVGVAIGDEEGLVVPVLRNADRMSFVEIELAVGELVRKTQQGKLSLDDLRGGTFTITNGGVFGSLLSTPILNPPQVGILGLHKIEQRPVVAGSEIAIRPMMYVALSYDHRIVDGREAVQFLVRVKELIEDPDRLLLEG